VACDLAFILERAADRRLARMRLALPGSTLGSFRGSSCSMSNEDQSGSRVRAYGKADKNSKP
jgi:hypothetical protein